MTSFVKFGQVWTEELETWFVGIEEPEQLEEIPATWGALYEAGIISEEEYALEYGDLSSADFTSAPFALPLAA